MKRIVFLILMLAFWGNFSMISSSAQAAPQATYELVKSNVGPGGVGSAGIYQLSSSIGQPDAGEVRAGIYTLGGGFWGGGVIVSVAIRYNVYLPLVIK